MKRSSLTAFALAIGICVPTFGAIQVTESFDDDPIARGWVGFNNRTAPQDYGFSAGDVTGSAVNPPGGTATAGGEMGGRLQRSSSPANFYGVDLGGEIDISTDPFSISGVLHVEVQNGGSGFNIGYSRGVSSYGSGGDPVNFIGMFFDDAADGYTLLSTNTGGRERDGGAPNLVAATTLPFSFVYDGAGTLTVNIDGTEFMHNFGGAIDSVDPLTHFGVFPVSATSDFSVVWFDDLTYTAISLVEPPDTTVHTWNQAGGGDYNITTNWGDFFLVPNANTETAIFGSAIVANSTVFTESSITVKNMQFDNANSYALAGAGASGLTLDADTGSASVTVSQGNHQFQLPVTLADPTTVDVAAASSMTFNNALNLGSQTLTKTGAGTMVVNNTLHTGTGSVVVSGGTLAGEGAVGGNVSNPGGGTVAPGNSEGTLEIDGTYSQSGGTLAIEIASATEFDLLDVSGAATLSSGTLSVDLLGTFTPAANAMFTVLTSAGLTNSLALGGPDGAMFSIVPHATNLILQFGAGQAGDYNGDGKVDAADYVTWRNGDSPDDSIAGYNTWRANFGAGSGAGSGSAVGAASAVPEPSAALLGLLGLVCCLAWFDRLGGRNMQFSLKAFRFPRVPRATLLAALAWVLTSSLASAQFLKVEDFTEDPMWQAVDNNIGLGSNEFFWQGDPFPPTNFAGGEPGEIGGVFYTNQVGYFADDIGTIDPTTTPFQASGKAFNAGGNGQALLGWFDKDGNLDHTGGAAINFIGWSTDDDRLRLYANGTELTVARNHQNPVTFSIAFDPTIGFGRLSGSVNGPEESNSAFIDLPEGAAASLGTFDSFGVLPLVNFGVDPARSSTWYYDDLVYSTSFTQPPITETEWTVDGSGNLDSLASYIPGLPPNSNERTLVFGDAITAPRVLFTDTPITAEGITFDNANQYTLAGTGSITLESDDTATAAITVVQGSHEFQVPLSLADNLAVTVPGGSTLSINNLLDLNGFTLTKSGAGTLLINNVIQDFGTINNSGSGSVVILGGAVPEPSSMLLVMMAAAGLTLVKRRR